MSEYSPSVRIYGASRRSENSPSVSGSTWEDRAIGASHRWSTNGNYLAYLMEGLQAGYYTCTLYFAETSSDHMRPGARVFDAFVGGHTGSGFTGAWSRNIDVYGAIGANTIGTITVNDVFVYGNGYLLVYLQRQPGSNNNPFISGINCY